MQTFNCSVLTRGWIHPESGCVVQVDRNGLIDYNRTQTLLLIYVVGIPMLYPNKQIATKKFNEMLNAQQADPNSPDHADARQSRYKIDIDLLPIGKKQELEAVTRTTTLTVEEFFAALLFRKIDLADTGNLSADTFINVSMNII